MSMDLFEYWPLSSQSILNRAFAVYKQVPFEARQTGYWVTHPITFKQCAQVIAFGPEYPSGTLFGRPVHTSPHIQPGEFYFETEPDEFPPSLMNAKITAGAPYVVTATGTFAATDGTFTAATGTFVTFSTVPATPMRWSATPEPDWLVAMAEEMAL